MESAKTPRLVWKWILEKLVDLPGFGVAFFNEVINSHISDIEEPHCRLLLERVALRNLEARVVSNQIDSDAILLMKAFIGQNLGPGAIRSSVKQRFKKELVLRVQTEVVLSVLRKDVGEREKDWAFYESELERVFGEAEEDYSMLDRKRELSALLKPQNQTKTTVAAYFEKFSINKLRNDLFSFIDEKRGSFKTVFLDQLSRDFLNANGKPFSEEPGGVEKSTKVEANANGKQDHVGSVIIERRDLGDRSYQEVRTSIVYSNRRKFLSTQDDIGDDELEEAEEGSARTKKPRKMPSTSIVNPLKTLLRQGVSELAVPASGPQSACLLARQELESCKQLPFSNRGEESLSGPEVMRSCSSAAHESISMEGAKNSLREPTRTNKYVVILDVELDGEGQVMKRLSTDVEASLIEQGHGDNHNKKGAQDSLPENGSKSRHPQNIIETEVVRKEASFVQSARKILVDKRKETPPGSPEVCNKRIMRSLSARGYQQEDNEKFVTKNEFIPLDSQDASEVDFLEVGGDGHEEVCHTCGEYGELIVCDGCPISMHFDCIKVLGLRLPKSEEDWYCPVCLSQKAAQEAAVAEKAAVASKEKLETFKMENKRRRDSREDDALHHIRQEKAVKQSRLSTSSLQCGANDRALKARQQSDEEPKVICTEGEQDSDLTKASLLSIVLRKALHQLNQLGEQDSVRRTLRVNELLVNASPKSSVENGAGDGSAISVSRVRISLTPQPQEISMTDPIAASTTGRESDRFARFSKKKGSEVDISAGSAEPAGAGVPEDRDEDEDLNADRGEKSEYRNRGALFSGRRKLPGLRRKRLPWTRQEEDALKEGVKQFSDNGSRGFQWRRILEFGQGRFDPSRTDVDLKDKWRNLVKGVS